MGKKIIGQGGQLTLTPAMFHILLALAARERHGYGVMQDVARLSEGRLRIGPATLYRSLGDLLAAGYIAEIGERPAPDLDDARRRYYRLTETGRCAVEAEVTRLERLIRTARATPLFASPGPLLGEGND